MKFTKEEAREKITAAFSSKVKKIDDWERTIKEHVENLFELLGEDSEIEIDKFSEKVVSMLNTQLGHLNKANKEVANGFEKQIADLKKQTGNVDDDDDDDNDDTKKEGEKKPKKDKALSKLLERIDNLEKELNAEKTAKAIDEKRDMLISEIKKKGVKNDKWINANLAMANITEDMDVEQAADSYVKLYNEFAAETILEDTPSGGGRANQLEQIKEAVKRAGELNKNNGM